MNKITNVRYSFDGLPLKDKSKSQSNDRVRQSQAATLILKKESELVSLKKRISALSIRRENNLNRAVNNQRQHIKQLSVRDESYKIRDLIAKQRRQQESQLVRLRERNLSSRMENYYKARAQRIKHQEERAQETQRLRTQSRENDKLIRQNRRESASKKQLHKQEMYDSKLVSRYQKGLMMESRKSRARDKDKLQASQLLRRGRSTDLQKSELQKIQSTLIYQESASRRAYRNSIQKLSTPSKTSRSYRSGGQRAHSKTDLSLI